MLTLHSKPTDGSPHFPGKRPEARSERLRAGSSVPCPRRRPWRSHRVSIQMQGPYRDDSISTQTCGPVQLAVTTVTKLCQKIGSLLSRLRSFSNWRLSAMHTAP